MEESADPHLGSGDHLQTGSGEPVRRYTHSVSPYRQQQDRQRKTIGHLREIVNSTHMAQDSDKTLEPHIDQHGRTYYMDHSTHTIAFNGGGGGGGGGVSAEPQTSQPRQDEMQTRRQMLDRRYQSLQRSFRVPRGGDRPRGRGQHQQQGSHAHLPSSGSVDNQSLTLTLAEAEAMFRGNAGGSSSNGTRMGGKKKSSGRAGRWLFGRKSSKTIQQQGGSNSSEDDTLMVTSPPPLESPASLSAQSSRESSTVRSGSSEPEVAAEVGGVSGESVAEETTEMTVVVEPRQNGMEPEQRASTSSDNSLPSDQVFLPAQAEEQRSSEPRPGEIESETAPRGDDSSTLGIAATLRSDPIVRGSGLTSMDQSAAMRARSRSQARRSQRRASDTDEDTNLEGSARPSSSSVIRTREGSSPPPPSSVSEEAGSGEGVEKAEKERSVRPLSEGLSLSPTLKFLTRKDLYTFLSSAGEVGEAFLANRGLMELVQRIRGDNRLLDKYQHSRQLVSALNSFADPHADMPGEWEKKLNRQGKVFFIDHTPDRKSVV